MAGTVGSTVTSVISAERGNEKAGPGQSGAGLCESWDWQHFGARAGERRLRGDLKASGSDRWNNEVTV